MRLLFKKRFDEYEITKPIWELEKNVGGRTQADRLAGNKLYWDNYYQYQHFEDDRALDARNRYFYRAVCGFALTSDLGAEKRRCFDLDKYLQKAHELGDYRLTYYSVLKPFSIPARIWDKGVKPALVAEQEPIYLRKNDLLLVREQPHQADLELVKRGKEVISEQCPSIASLGRSAWDECKQRYLQQVG